MSFCPITYTDEPDYTPDTIDTDTSMFKPGVVDKFIESIQALNPAFINNDTGREFAFYTQQIKLVAEGYRGAGPA